MPRTPTHVQQKFQAQHLFTDREEPQQAFAQALLTPQGKEDYRLLNFYGIGGLGKTALCEQFTKKLSAEKKENKHLGWAKLDFEVTTQRDSVAALLDIRLQLANGCGMNFPAFDTAFFRHYAFVRKGHDIRVDHPGLFKQHNDLLQDVSDFSNDIVNEIPGVGLFYKYTNKLSAHTQKWWQCRGKKILEGLDELEQHKLQEKLPTFLGADIHEWLFEAGAQSKEEQRRLVILLDTYEALWRDRPNKKGEAAMRVDAWLRKLAEETPGVLYVVLGREKLNWSEIEPEWENDIESHLLGGLSDKDANRFLQKVPINEVDIRQTIVNSSAGVPFYLDLQVDLYESLKQRDAPLQQSDFGGKEREIIARFTDHLDDAARRTLEVISHARFIDEPLCWQLAEAYLGGKASVDFKQLTHYSFWRQEGGTWHLHGLMREYLQAHRQKQEPKLFKEIHQHLFELYDCKLEPLEQVVDITNEQTQALMEASYHLEQCDAEQFAAWANKRGVLFLEAYAFEQIETLFITAKSLAERHLGEEHLDTAAVLNNLALLYQAQGDYAKVEPLLQRSLAIWEAALGAQHPDVATSLNNLAELYKAQGDYPKAEPLYQRSLTILEAALGGHHPHVATSLNNLAGLHEAQGEYVTAEPLYQRAIAILEAAFPDGHPNIDVLKNGYARLKRDSAL